MNAGMTSVSFVIGALYFFFRLSEASDPEKEKNPDKEIRG